MILWKFVVNILLKFLQTKKSHLIQLFWKMVFRKKIIFFCFLILFDKKNFSNTFCFENIFKGFFDINIQKLKDFQIFYSFCFSKKFVFWKKNYCRFKKNKFFQNFIRNFFWNSFWKSFKKPFQKSFSKYLCKHSI